MYKSKKTYLQLALFPFILYGCGTSTAPHPGLHFTAMPAAQTNIHFNNQLTESDSVNVFTNEYMYNGAGVATADFNSDGLQDIFFCGSMLSSRLYLNKGNFVFEDITQTAGVSTTQWCTGVSIVDINNDGFPDIYVCTSHSADKEKRKNQLFINDGGATGSHAGPHFTEQAAAYGLADTGYATQAAFFDYDKDGDLDMYLLNHRLYSHTANNLQPKDTSGFSPAQDRLYRNDGIPAGGNHPVFHDVTMQAGIKEDGYGLGIVITDVNNDNWPDIYVANDYIGNDLLWLNSRNGSFTNVIATALRHQSYNSMGVDAADINNDLLPDIAVLDMLPENNERKKMMSAATNQEKSDMQQRFGYQPSYVRNMLQLNNGNRRLNGITQPFYSEIGQLAGMFQTDWSWSVLLADFDNDGWKDMHITNGLGKDVTNNDYNAFANGQSHTSSYTFGSNRTEEPLDKKTITSLRKNIDGYGAVPMNNYLLLNNHQLGFTDITAQAGLHEPSLSNGAAYADLDNDGDLDLVINNMNQPAFVWRNDVRKTAHDTNANFLTVQLAGPPANKDGVESKVIVFNKGNQQLLEAATVRGFSSATDSRLHFGVSNNTLIDSIHIQWPDDKVETRYAIKANQLIILRYQDAVAPAPAPGARQPFLFTEMSNEQGIRFTHKETPNFDFGSHQPLLQKYSQLGPCLAVADLNGDGLADFFEGGAANQSGEIFLQQANGNFTSTKLVPGSKPGEDLGAVFFDADGDKDTDLLVTGGSFEFAVAAYNQPHLYLNDGNGNFTVANNALPAITAITKAAAVADYDGDGDLDIFMSGRLLPQQYPQLPRSYILQNNQGRFTDVTETVCPALVTAGMVTGALFTDFNNDKKPDLLICGEWMPLRFFNNNGRQLQEITGETGLASTHGLWRCLQQADIDHDGDMDYIAGNTGMNNRYGIGLQKPLMLFAKDIDKNGLMKMIPAYYIKDNENKYQLFPAIDRNQLAEQIPVVKKKYFLHKDFSTVTMQQLLADLGSEDWLSLQCAMATTVWVENLGNGKFTLHALPLEAQFAPVNCIVADDIDGDGKTDLLIGGNEYQADAATGRYDASYGLLLKGDGRGGFLPVKPVQSGLIIDGDVKDMRLISTKGRRKILLAAINDNALHCYQLNNMTKQ